MVDSFNRNLTSGALSRREFLSVSLLGAAAISSASGLALIAGSSANAQAAAYTVLREADVEYFGAMLPAVIVQADSLAARTAFLDSFDRMLIPASRHSVDAIQGLVDLLTGSLTRPLMTLSWSGWGEMDATELNAVLELWRDSRIGLRRIAYGLTTTLVRTAWYMQTDAQAISGYPGPPKKIVEQQAEVAA